MAGSTTLVYRLKYALALVTPALILGGVIMYADFGTPERRQRYEQRQQENERISRERRLQRRHQMEMENEKKKMNE